MNTDLTIFFKGISDPNRVKIMTLIKDRELSVSQIVTHFQMKQPSISHHLNVLKNAGIVTSRKDGKEIFYSLNLCCINDCCMNFKEKFNDRGDQG